MGQERINNLSTTWFWPALIGFGAGAHVVILLDPVARVGTTLLFMMFVAYMPALPIAAYFDTKQVYGVNDPTTWRSRVNRCSWIIGMSVPIICPFVSIAYAIRRWERTTEMRFMWWTIALIGAFLLTLGLSAQPVFEEPSHWGADVLELVTFGAWILTPIAGYFDVRNIISFSEEKETRRALIKNHLWPVGLAVPGLNLLVALVYAIRRRELLGAPRPGWWKLVGITVALSVVSLVMMTMFGDSTIEENTALQDMAIFLYLFAWLLMPVGIYYDAKPLSQATGWPRRVWPWFIITLIPFINLFASSTYLYYRYKKTEVIKDARKQVEDSLSEAKEARNSGVRLFKSRDYDNATEQFKSARKRLEDAHELTTDIFPDLIDEIEQQLAAVQRRQKQAKLYQLVDMGDTHATKVERLVDEQSWEAAQQTNAEAKGAYEQALALAGPLNLNEQPFRKKIGRCESYFDQIAQRIIETVDGQIIEAEDKFKAGSHEAAHTRLTSALQTLETADSAENETATSLNEIKRRQENIKQRMDAIEDAAKHERLKSLASDAADAVSRAQVARSKESDGDALAFSESALSLTEDALELAREIDPKWVPELKTRRERAETLVDEIETERSAYETATTAVASIQKDLDTIAAEIEHNPDRAFDQLQEVGAEIDEVRNLTAAVNDDELADSITASRERYEMLRKQTRETLTIGPPAQIPTTGSRSLDYDAIERSDPIGSGGNADVYYATIESDGVEIAIKEPRMSGTLHTEDVNRLLEEAETWASLDEHDHIVSVIDYGSQALPWIAMEYMDAGHLGERAGDMDTDQALWTAIQTTKAVRHAHRRGVAHLDLKPKNILFRSAKDGWDVPKVADWGLSKRLLNRSKSIKGISPHYAAPEQFDDQYGDADDITDIYQLGAVFYELFTGRPPFEGQPTKVMRAVIDDEPTSPSEIADIPVELDEILLTALAKNKDDRYETVIYFRDELRRIYTTRPSVLG